MKEKTFRRTAAASIILSGLSIAAIVDGLFENRIYEKRLYPEAVRLYVDVAPQEQLTDALQRMNKNDASIKLSNDEERLRNLRTILLDEQAKQDAALLEQQNQTNQSRNEFVRKGTPARLPWQMVLGGLVGLPIGGIVLAGSLAIRLNNVLIKEIEKLKT